ncbi:PEP-CTERM sorting domain-containing protein, partial [Candidatus Contendibacter odensensis]
EKFAVPEPNTAILIFLGLAGLSYQRRNQYPANKAAQ